MKTDISAGPARPLGRRAALKGCEGKRRDWQKFYRFLREKR